MTYCPIVGGYTSVGDIRVKSFYDCVIMFGHESGDQTQRVFIQYLAHGEKQGESDFTNESFHLLARF